MRKISVYRCPECRKPFRTLGAWANHMNNAHPEVRPKGYSDRRFFYYNLTGKTHGNCIVCKKETEWNEETSKYNRFCSNPKCKEEYRNMFKERMISKYGKVTMMDDPEFARKALANRRISGKYRFSDGGEVNYVGSYEKDFLIMMDKFLGYKSTDIMAPSPHTYYYEYDGEKHYYIPDFFIPNLNLEIEIKQNESTHPKILAVDKVKEQKKDEVMISNKAISYIKLVDKKYEPFIEYLLSLKERIPEKDIDQPEVVKYKLAQEAVYGDTDSKYQKYLSTFESIMGEELQSHVAEIAQEGYVFDSKIVEYRVDEFKNGKENILFIAGLAGSGKTTLSREFGKDKNIEIIALDDMMVPGLFSDENLKDYHHLIYKFFTSTEIGKFHRDNKEYTEDMVLNVLPAFIQFISNNLASKKIVIEGFYFVNDKFFDKVKSVVKKHSIMILGTSMIKAFYRRMKRNEKYPKRSRHKRSELIINALQNDIHWQNGLNDLIKEVKSWNESIAQEAVVGSFIDTRPYDNPIPTPAPEPEYVPQNIIPSKNEIGPGALLKSDNAVKAMIPCVMDEISGEPSDGTKPVNLPVEKINMDQNPDPNGEVKITEREKAVERVNAILTRFDQYSILSRKRYLNELKSLILKWNVDVDLSKYPKVRKLLLDMNSPATEVYTPGYIFDYYGTPFPGTQTYAMEGRIENPDDLYPVYILLTHSSTLLSSIIKKFTCDKYTHAAICFDPTFKKLYTFGRKKIGGGFSIESPNSDFYKERPDIPYGIYCVFVTSEQLKEMKKRLQVFIDNEDRYKYHFSGLIKFIFGKESENDTRYFCSGFVVDILQAGGLSKSRSYSLYKPQDLTHLYSSYKIDSGNGLQNINQDRILTNTNIVKNKYIQRFYKK